MMGQIYHKDNLTNFVNASQLTWNYKPYNICYQVDVLLRQSECYENIVVTQSDNGSTVLEFTQQDISREITVRSNKNRCNVFPKGPVIHSRKTANVGATVPSLTDDYGNAKFRSPLRFQYRYITV